MPKVLSAEDIEVFSEAITHFFTTITGETAQVRTAYLLTHVPPVCWNDFNGMIDIRGELQGSICFSAPRAMLSHVLLKMGEEVFTEDRHADMVGEIANTLAGRARRHFGESLAITPPRLVSRNAPESIAACASSYAIPLTWHGYEADLVIQL